MPVTFQFHRRTLERRERASSIVSARFGPRHILPWLLLVIDASDVRRGRWKYWLDAGAGIGDGRRKEHAVGPEIKHALRFGAYRFGIYYRDFAIVKRGCLLLITCSLSLTKRIPYIPTTIPSRARPLCGVASRPESGRGGNHHSAHGPLEKEETIRVQSNQPQYRC